MAPYKWQFFRAGGVDQVSLRSGQDLVHLAELDAKLWVALAMPNTDVDVDVETMKLLDTDGDNRVRVDDIRGIAVWIGTTFVNPDDVLRSADSVALSAIKDPKVLAAAKRVLADLKRPDATSISVADATGVAHAFAETVLNGDGIIVPGSADDPAIRKVIEAAIGTHGGALDRSGKPGIDRTALDAFYAEVDALVAWAKAGREPANLPLGERTAAAFDAFTAVEAKLEDYFARSRLAAFDSRAAAGVGAQEADFLAMAAKPLTVGADDIVRLPLAAIDDKLELAVGKGLNPAWAGRIRSFVDAAVVPIAGDKAAITPDDVAAVATKLAPFGAWRAARPATKLGALDLAWLEGIAADGSRATIAEIIAHDAALSEEYAQLASVEKLVRVQRDFGRVVRNFVNFSDFYSTKDGAFCAGTLYLDSRACRLCLPVGDAGKHAALAGAAAAYLAYCDIVRGGVKKQIVAAFTNGDGDYLIAGRNGVFYDRAGDDWDATIVKVVANPISIREAFWAPYKKLVRMIEDQVGKRAAAADAAAEAKLASTASTIATVDKVAAVPAGAPAAVAAVPATKPEPKKIDVGTVAAIGVAIGGIGALIVGVLSAFLGLGAWMPIGLVALLLLISGPSMALAWLKLRQRNLGPLLDANGWAINGRVRINTAFGAALTELAKLPPGASRRLDDPYAEKQRPWKLYFAILFVVVLAASWYRGALDKWLPGTTLDSVGVLGKYAPAYKAPDAPATAPVAPAAGAGSGSAAP
jgi:hypothetical protein